MKNYNHNSVDARLASMNNPSDTVYNVISGSAVTITVPSGAEMASFTVGGAAAAVAYINFVGGTAAAPSGNVTDGTGVAAVSFVPKTYYLRGITTFSVIVPSGALSIEFFSSGN